MMMVPHRNVIDACCVTITVMLMAMTLLLLLLLLMMMIMMMTTLARRYPLSPIATRQGNCVAAIHAGRAQV
jgi:Na+-transporting methylmalonyl-CoA/oxaloacetate decarboxylase gamma subunit